MNSSMTPTELVRHTAKKLGFTNVGIAKAEYMSQEAERLKEWLGLGYHGTMSYMENHFDKRTNPTLLVPGAKSIIVLTYNYHTELKQEDPQAPKISSYAYGRDRKSVV